MSKLYIFDAISSILKNEERDQKDLNISDQLKTLVPCFTICFFGI